MSDDVPFDIQRDIIKRLPVKSLIRFRSISKSWKSLIDSSDFVANYTSQRQHLLIRYHHEDYYDEQYVSIVDDDSFPQVRVTLTPPLLCTLLKDYTRIIATSRGLLCFYGRYKQGRVSCRDITDMAVIWNPSVRKAVAVVVPADGEVYKTKLGFGVCRETSDIKIVKITYNSLRNMGSVTRIPWKVEVFALSTGEWRSLDCNLPCKSIHFGHGQSVGGICYWIATDRRTVDDRVGDYNMIVSFDMTNEVFGEENLPGNLGYEGSLRNLSISNIRESLVVLEHNEQKRFVVWLMEDGVTKSFTKLYTIYAQSVRQVLVFRKSGEPVIDVAEVVEYDPGYFDHLSLLAVYDPKSKHICGDLGFDRASYYDVHSYTETLLLHDQPSFTVFNNGKRQTLH